MVVVDGQGIPLGGTITSASPAEVRLAEETLKTVRVPRPGRGRPKSRPQRLIADKAYDSEKLRAGVGGKGIRLLVPHRRNRKKCRKQWPKSENDTNTGGKSSVLLPGWAISAAWWSSTSA